MKQSEKLVTAAIFILVAAIGLVEKRPLIFGIGLIGFIVMLLWSETSVQRQRRQTKTG